MATNYLELMKAEFRGRKLDKQLALAGQVNQDFLRDCADIGADRCDWFKKARRARDGDHQVPLTARQRTYLERSGLPWSENFCGATVRSRKRRLGVEGWDVEQDTADGENAEGTEESQEQDLAEIVRDWWRQNRMPTKQGKLWRELLTLGEYFIIVDIVEEDGKRRPRFSLNAPDGMKAIYSDDHPDQLELVVKVWASTFDGQRIQRMNLWFADRIEKWYTLSSDGSSNGNWHAFVDAEDYQQAESETEPTAVWPIPNVDDKRQPLGVNVVHVRLDDAPLREAIPRQDGLNKSVLDLFDILDYHASPQEWASGVDGEFDAKRSPGTAWVTSQVDAKFGRLESVDPKGARDTIMDQLARWSAACSIPLFELLQTGTFPSGEALKSAEGSSVRAAEDDALQVTDPLSDMFRIAVKLYNFYAQTNLPTNATFVPQWKSPHTRNELLEAQTAQIWQDLGVSKHTSLANAGFDPDEEAELRQQEADEAVAAIQAAMDTGQVTPGDSVDTPAPVPAKPPAKKPAAKVAPGAR